MCWELDYSNATKLVNFTARVERYAYASTSKSEGGPLVNMTSRLASLSDVLGKLHRARAAAEAKLKGITTYAMER